MLICDAEVFPRWCIIMAGVTAGRVPRTNASRARHSASSAAYKLGVRGTTTRSRRGFLARILGDAGGSSTCCRRERGKPWRRTARPEGPAPTHPSSPAAAPEPATRSAPEPVPGPDCAASAGASTAWSVGSATKGSGVGGPQTGGTDGDLPVDAERAEAVSAGEP